MRGHRGEPTLKDVIHRLAVLVGLIVACSAPPAATPSASLSPTLPPASPAPTSTASPTPPSIATPIPLPNVAQVSAPSGAVVWAIVGGTRLFRSTDRGDTWQERPLPAEPINGQVSFVGDREGWESIVGSPATGCQAQLVTIWHTADAGSTWQQLAGNGLGFNGCKGALQFADRSTGYLAAYRPLLIYFTVTGGSSWASSGPFSDPPGFTTAAGAHELVPAALRAFGTVVLADVMGQSIHYAYRSSDGGATWRYASAASNQLDPIAFVTATRWLQISAPGASKETTDAGATWHAFTTDYQQAAPVVPAITFGDAQVGYATARGAIQRTIDGGAHWTAIHTPGTF